MRVVSGSVFDVAVDLRKSSPTFGKWHGVELSAENHCQFWVPAGFAHGFVVLSETADFLYKTTEYYALRLRRQKAEKIFPLCIKKISRLLAPSYIGRKDTSV